MLKPSESRAVPWIPLRVGSMVVVSVGGMGAGVALSRMGGHEVTADSHFSTAIAVRVAESILI
eukprot:599271-Amorphochlora_amoeboformis.AAC.3